LSALSRQAQRRRVQQFYDRWSPVFVRDFGTTLQAGFVKATEDSCEEPESSSLLLAQRAGIRDGDVILDAGCGVGGPAVAIARAYPHALIRGVTISPVQAALARDLVAHAGLDDRVVVSLADCHELPFGDESFDVVLFFESCGYSPDRAALFAEAARALRPGGRVYVKDVFARTGPLTDEEVATLAAFDELWQLAASPTIPEITAALDGAGCTVVDAGELAHVGTDRFLAAMFEPDADTLFRLSELGRAFGLSGPCPTFFGEVRARRQ
jgi:cyclopropane fatty-acyl-phospholipid synthase-like methyltransferase